MISNFPGMVTRHISFELVRSLGKGKSKAFVWTDIATRQLLAFYGHHEKDFHSSKYTKMQVWNIISEKMKDAGYITSGLQCDARFKYLKLKYKAVKDANRQSGNGRETCKFYDELEELLAKKPEMSPVSTCSSSGTFEEFPTEPVELQSPQAGQSKRKSNGQESAQSAKKRQESRDEAMERRHKERMERHDKHLELLKQFLDKM